MNGQAHPPQILLVEDNPDNRLLVTVLLEQRYRVVAAASAEEALVLLPMVAPDLLLIDISLPGMDGVELLAEIRRGSTFARLPAIAFTAHAMEGDRERFLGQGFDAYLSKPILREHLLFEAVEQALASRGEHVGHGLPGDIIPRGA